MGWCSCFKPSTSLEDPYDAVFELTLAVSQQEAEAREVHEAEQLALAMEEFSREEEAERRRTRVLEEERKRTRMIEEDAQIANGFLYDDRERQINNNNSALEDEQLAKALAKSLKSIGKRKQFEEQMKIDEQLAMSMVESPPRTESQKSIPRRVSLAVDEQLDKAIKESLKVKGKRKQFEDEQVKNDEQIAAIYQKSLNNMVDSPPRLTEIKNIYASASLNEEEQLEKVIRESLKGKGLIEQSKDEVEDDENLPVMNPPRSMCGGCDSEIEHGRSVDVLGVPWHPECLWCDACHKAIAIHEVENHVSNSRGKFHKSCYQRYCYVCNEKVKIKMFNQHPFWKENYCPVHDSDKTPMCCSCERLQPRGNYVTLGDNRRLCLECMESAVMDSDECQPLHFEIREYFEGLNMKIEKQFPFLLVEKQALNEAEKEEKIDNQYEVVTRGICLSEAQTVRSVSKKPTMDRNKQLVGMTTESQMVVRECEVTAILILYGLPRLLTGYILAHEMMHAYLRLNKHRIRNNVMEEGLCQVLGHMWLESQRYTTTDATEAAASTSRTPPAAASESKKGKCSDFEKKFVEFCKNEIETDESPVYGLGFKRVNHMVSNSSLKETLEEIIRWG